MVVQTAPPFLRMPDGDFLGTVAPIEREIRELAIGLQAVKDEQEYIVIRERVHRNTAESTNDRVKWWSIAQAIVLVAVCGFQVYYLQVSGSLGPLSCLRCRNHPLDGLFPDACLTAVVLRGQASDLAWDLNGYRLWCQMRETCRSANDSGRLMKSVRMKQMGMASNEGIRVDNLSSTKDGNRWRHDMRTNK